jgi:hypothetical protein
LLKENYKSCLFNNNFLLFYNKGHQPHSLNLLLGLIISRFNFHFFICLFWWRSKFNNEVLSAILRKQFAGFQEIIKERKNSSFNNKPKRFEFVSFSDFRSMNQCLKRKFIDFEGNKLLVSRGFLLVSYHFFFFYKMNVQPKYYWSQ